MNERAAVAEPCSGRAMNVVVMGDRFGFPYGTGASARVLAYAKGLQASAARVKVLCTEPSESPDDPRPLNAAVRGWYEGVEYAYSYGRTSRPVGRWARAPYKVLKYPRFLLEAWRWAAPKGGLDAVLVYSLSLRWIAAAWVVCRLTGAVLVHEDCELPFYWSAMGPGARLRRRLYYGLAVRGFDGCLVISTYLERLCASYGARTLRVPVLAEVPVESPPAAAGDDVTFCGWIDHPEVPAVLEAFAAVAARFPEVRLCLVGPVTRAGTRAALERRAGELGIAARLDFAGEVPREELAGILRASRVLVLPRPSAAFSQAGLPTKVADYLASGRPVVTSAVGDLPLYLRDGVDARLAPPDDPAAFAACLADVLADPAAADAMGARGLAAARAQFDPAVHGARIVRFIEELRRVRGRHRGRGGAR